MRLIHTMQDDQLIQRCIDRDPIAQKSLYQSYLPYILTIVRRYGIHSSAERDAIQEVFIEVFSSLSKFDETKGTLKTWIRTLAVYKILKIKRASGSLRIVDIADHQHDTNANLVNYQEHPPEYILEAIKSLPDGYQTVFNLYEVDGYNHNEIAKMLDISPEGSRSQLSRARGILRKKLVNNKYMTK